MNRTLAIIAMTGTILMGSPAPAVNSMSPSALVRRQLAVCMTKHMSADRTLSYNEATKMCKDQLKSRTDTMAAANVTKPVASP
jgi:hypothetical protein